MSTTDPGTDPGIPGDLETLEQEREFLLRSLADLDSEYEAGDIEDDDYRSLTNDYTARAAAVLRAIEAIKPTKKRGASRATARPARSRPPTTTSVKPTKTGPKTDRRVTAAADDAADGVDGAERALLSAALQSRRRWRTTAVVIVVLGFGVLAAWVVAQSSGSRLPGQTASGNSQLTGTTASGGVDQRLVTAADLVNQGKVADALKLYDQVLQDDPNQPVALADGGWLQAQAGLAGNRPELVDSGLARIDKGESIAPDFADAHFFRGFLLLRAKNDAPGAVTELRLYLSIVDPSAPQVPQVQTLLQEAIKTAGPNVPAGPNAPATPAAAAAPTTTSKP